jgi:hypothetical protein
MAGKRVEKHQITQASILGRAERLAGNGLEVNPHRSGSYLWEAFVDGWSLPLDIPIMGYLAKAKKSNK